MLHTNDGNHCGTGTSRDVDYREGRVVARRGCGAAISRITRWRQRASALPVIRTRPLATVAAPSEKPRNPLRQNFSAPDLAEHCSLAAAGQEPIETPLSPYFKNLFRAAGLALAKQTIAVAEIEAALVVLHNAITNRDYAMVDAAAQEIAKSIAALRDGGTTC
jgi:hypothetical protein